MLTNGKSCVILVLRLKNNTALQNKMKEVNKMANGTFYGNSGNGFSFSPDRSRDTEFYSDTKKSSGFLTYEDRMVIGSRSTGYYGTFRG